MTPARFRAAAARYPSLRLAVIGDFCLDRYLEIDPGRTETSIETGLPVYNVTQVRSQPGAAGTVLNNLVALGVGQIQVIGFCGDDGEGYELRRALSCLPGVDLEHFITTPDRRTFTYCKPLLIESGQIPRELNRLDSKNWTPTPASITKRLVNSVQQVASTCDAMIVMDQVDLAETGVVTTDLLGAVAQVHGSIPVVADSRRSLRDYPPVIYKMNSTELSALTRTQLQTMEEIQQAAGALAGRNQREVVVTLAERGVVGARPDGRTMHIPAPPVTGAIDVVGAGDAVTANLTAALASGASLQEALEITTIAAFVVIQQLGTTGTASPDQIADVLTG